MDAWIQTCFSGPTSPRLTPPPPKLAKKSRTSRQQAEKNTDKTSSAADDMAWEENDVQPARRRTMTEERWHWPERRLTMTRPDRRMTVTWQEEEKDVRGRRQRPQRKIMTKEAVFLIHIGFMRIRIQPKISKCGVMQIHADPDPGLAITKFW
jgi:hypothetical protein